MKYKITAVLLAGLIISIYLTGCSNTPAPSDNASSGDSANAAVTFTATDTEGTEVSSDLFANSALTMINVWATYCNPCLNEMPGLGELASEYDTSDLHLIGIISDVQQVADEETFSHALDLIEQTGADYPHLLLNESLYYGLLTDVTAVPTTFFIDSDGIILDTIVGSMEKEDWKEKINEFLQEM